jgi:hypothetical protein
MYVDVCYVLVVVLGIVLDLEYAGSRTSVLS